ncbi:MAG: DUF2905 domain-containing protein [Acidobacteriota bacterium]
MTDPLSGLGRILIFLGLGIVTLGLLLTLVGRVPFLGRLPGDVVFRKGNLTFYFPLATSILLSLLLTLLLWLFRR